MCQFCLSAAAWRQPPWSRSAVVDLVSALSDTQGALASSAAAVQLGADCLNAVAEQQAGYVSLSG
jgi:hypothetical protein